MAEIRLTVSNVCSAMKAVAIGTRVMDVPAFMKCVAELTADHDFESDRVRGQGYIPMPKEFFPLVSCGIGKRSADPADYVVRAHRGRVNAYLRRALAAEVESLACIVYDRVAYRGDPDVQGDLGEFKRITVSGATHVIVAVLAAAGPKPPLTPLRFVANLAGGNKEAQVWTAEEIRDMARQIAGYDDEWCVVAD